MQLSKRVKQWLIAAILGLGLVSLGPSFFIFPKNISFAVPIGLLLLIKAIVNVVVFHIIITGPFLKKYYYSIPFWGIHLLQFTFMLLHWEGANILRLAVILIALPTYCIYFFKKQPRSNIDIFILFYLIIINVTHWNMLFSGWGEKTVSAAYLTASLQLIPTCILHIKNEYLNYKAS